MINLQYPVGKFNLKEFPDKKTRKLLIQSLSDLPGKVKETVQSFDNNLLDVPYREGGWTARQVIHHLPDSHMNAFIRFKLTLTESTPVIRPYNQDEWAKLPDVKNTPVEVSISLLESIHKRWVVLLNSMEENDFRKKYIHPESGEVSLAEVLALYEWHGRHHLAHITSVVK
jgi:DinB superfamily